MKLYGSYTSPFVRHCRIALAQENIEFEFVEADYAASAANSPTAKVPFMQDGDLKLTDSSSIVKYIREKSGGVFLADVEEYENFAMTNTVLDSAVNIFLFENEGFGPDKVKYLVRQQDRIANGLAELNRRVTSRDFTQDGTLRCACFLGWGVFRKRINLDGLDNLRDLLAAANKVDAFAATAPPA